jgi:hypothetical protein
MQPEQVGPAHLPYTPENAKKLKTWRVNVVFISRDLRDIAVSLFHFVMENKWNHPYNPYLKHLKTHEERLLAIIRGVPPTEENLSKFGIRGWPNIYEFTHRQFGWLNDPGICKITFENLVRHQPSQNQSIMKIIDYLWADLQQQGMTKQALFQKMKGNIDPKHSGTFRKGTIGGWKEEFTDEHKNAFKQVAGNFLIQLGYEKDDNW